MSAVGEKIDQFAIPVCNVFEAKLLNDQVCYQVDLNQFSQRNNIERELEFGFNFLMDFNEDRQVTIDESFTLPNPNANEYTMSRYILKLVTDSNQHSIHFNTIGMHFMYINYIYFLYSFFTI